MKTANVENDQLLMSASLSEIIAHVVDVHHAFVRDQTQSIDQHIRELMNSNVGNTRIAELHQLNQTLASEIAVHIRKEEDVLFPAIISLEKASELKAANANLLPFKMSSRIRLLMLEDEGTKYLLSHFIKGVAAFHPSPHTEPAYKKLLAAIEIFESDLKRHIHVENSILFPKAIRVEEQLLKTTN